MFRRFVVVAESDIVAKRTETAEPTNPDRVWEIEKVTPLEFLLKKHPAAWRRSQQNRSDNELFRLNPELAQEK